MSVYIYITKRDGKAITADEVKAAVAKAPRHSLTDQGMVQVPCGGNRSIWLELTRGALLFQVQAGHEKHGEAIVQAIRRFAGCIPSAVVDGEGEIFDPLPCEGADEGGGGAKAATGRSGKTVRGVGKRGRRGRGQ